MFDGNGDTLHPDGILLFYRAFWKDIDKDLKSKNDQARYLAIKFCRSPWCCCLVESAGGNYDAFLEAKGLAGDWWNGDGWRLDCGEREVA